MFVLTWQIGYRSRVPVLFYDAIGNFETAIQVGALRRKQVGAKSWDANDA